MGLILLILLLGGYFVWSKARSFKITEKVDYIYGPFTCQQTTLLIKQSYQVNNLEGAVSLVNVVVRYGDIEFKSYLDYQKQFEQKDQVQFKFDDYENSLDKTQSFFQLAEGDELSSRGLRPDPRYRVLLATDAMASEEEVKGFVDCFKKNRAAIYDQMKNPNNQPPQFSYFDKVYFLKI